MRHFFLIAASLLLVTSAAVAQSGKPLYTITVTRSGLPLGEIKVEMFPDIAPKHVANFDSLVAIGFYNETAFHRVVPGFVIQGGDPNSRSGDVSTWGFGDPLQTTVPAEFSRVQHKRGIISAARTPDPNSATSQFFVCVATAAHLDGKYSVYGRVVEGLAIVDTIVGSPVVDGTQRPIEKIAMTIIRTGTDETIPAVPTLVFPANDTTGIGVSQTVRWSAVEGAILYEIERSTTPDFSVVDYRDSVIVTSVVLRNMTLGGVAYYWRVRASNGGVRGPFSEPFQFTTSGDASVAIPREQVPGKEMNLSSNDQ